MKFSLGQIVATPAVLETLTKCSQSPQDFIERHARGDWGMVDAPDAQANEIAIRDGGRILSAYTAKDGTKIWVITEADQASTCILLPEEY